MKKKKREQIQTTLDGKNLQKVNKDWKPVVPEKTDAEIYTEEYCTNQILKEGSLWDMRCWEKRDKEEALKWLALLRKNKAPYNMGHTVLCIQWMMKLGITDEKIADIMMQNTGVTFKNRIVQCWDDPKKCPKYKKQRNYGNDICAECYNDERKLEKKTEVRK